MNALQKKMLSALPEYLQNEHAINTIARLNNTTFEDAVSVVWLRFAEQQEKNKNTDNISHDLICAHKSPTIQLAQTYALTTKEAECIINAQLNRLESATADELYAAGCDYLSGKIMNSARSQLRRELSPGSKKTFSLDGEPVNQKSGVACDLHETIADNNDDALAWIIAAETVEERERELLDSGTTFHNIDIEQSALEKTPADVAKALCVTLRRGQQIVKQMRSAAENRLNVGRGGAGQTELF
jgi:hypothetical protein